MAKEITKKANAFIADHYDRLSLALPKGMKAEIHEYMNRHPGQYRSLTDLICKAIQKELQKDMD